MPAFILAAPLAVKAGGAGTAMLYSTATGQYVAAATTATSAWTGAAAGTVTGALGTAAAYAAAPTTSLWGAYTTGMTFGSIPWYHTGQTAAHAAAVEVGKATTVAAGLVAAYYTVKGVRYAVQNPEEAKANVKAVPRVLKCTWEAVKAAAKAPFVKAEG